MICGAGRIIMLSGDERGTYEVGCKPESVIPKHGRLHAHVGEDNALI